MRLIKLSDSFYQDYAGCDELMEKAGRPYLFLSVLIDGKRFAVPLRHNINHPFCFPTLPPAGLDFSKSVIITNLAYVSDEEPRIDPEEWNIIVNNEAKIMHEFRKYLRRYRHAQRNPEIPRYALILKYSTLQYFDA